MEFRESMRMEGVRSFLLAESNRDHLHETGFDRSMEIGMGFDPSDRDDRIGVISEFVEKDRNTFTGFAEVNSFHALIRPGSPSFLRSPRNGRSALAGLRRLRRHGFPSRRR